MNRYCMGCTPSLHYCTTKVRIFHLQRVEILFRSLFDMKHKVSNTFPPQFGLVNRFRRYILDREGSSKDTMWASLSNNSLSSISDLPKHCTFQVTTGGVPLFEVLDVDGVTGGFNFQK
ncbi:hypothetical protein Bca52824_056379 [Brassica carinata]|uniref:Uncharacterized protein n=1 Tax=Brassica carinata TaxID=52824 RepID=A0A8X7UCQ9_BRACI|nr:hypothetical protein Bca52824_056379 [Brassica carinata]